jgi:hypothetical protein
MNLKKRARARAGLSRGRLRRERRTLAGRGARGGRLSRGRQTRTSRSTRLVDDLALAVGLSPEETARWTVRVAARAGSAALAHAALARGLAELRAGRAGGAPQRARAYLEAAVLHARA